MPRRTSHQNLALFLCWAALLLSSPVSAAPRRQNNNNKDSNNNNNPLASLHQHYEQLSPKGKAVAGATAGFVGSRIALKTVTRVVKYGAAAFIAAEVLQLTGVMDQIPGTFVCMNECLYVCLCSVYECLCSVVVGCGVCTESGLEWLLECCCCGE